MTYHVTDKFDVQIGGRESRIRQQFYQYSSGLLTEAFFGSPPPYNAPVLHAGSNPATYLLTPRFKISPDLMVYARLASGFSPGGANSGPNVPPQFGPQKTKDYEIGAKGDFLEYLLSIDASLYYIDFVGLQREFYNVTTGLSYIANGGKAKSQGIELIIEARPATGLKVGGWVVFSDAELTDIPEGVILAQTAGGGPVTSSVADQLPNNSRFSANVSVDQEFPITSSVIGFVGVTESYMGERQGPYAIPRQSYPAYAKTDLCAGSKFNSWAANFYVDNLTDRRSVISGDDQGFISYSRYLIQPRTIDFSVTKNF